MTAGHLMLMAAGSAVIGYAARWIATETVTPGWIALLFAMLGSVCMLCATTPTP